MVIANKQISAEAANVLHGQSLDETEMATQPQQVSFAGPKANLNDSEQRAYALAQQMESAGKSRDEIWQATGKLGAPWWQDSEGQWWMEFSDDRAKLHGSPFYHAEPLDSYDKKTDTYREGPDMDAWRKPNAKLGEVYDHPDFYRLYPELKNLDLRIADLQGITGFFTPKKSLKGLGIEKPQIALDPYQFFDEEYPPPSGPYDLGANADRKGPTGDLRGVFVHEPQHAIQDKEDAFPNDPAHLPGEATPVEVHATLAELRRKMSMEERLATPPWLMEEKAKKWYSQGHKEDDGK